uniref:hypothetical protein n=1 Tax=Cecembia sp. TaxID=1898110 RepID=UPI0025C4D15E
SDLNLVKVDSVQVDYLGMLNLMDVHPATGKLLLFNMQKSLFVMANLDGKVEREFSKQGGPDNFGSFPLGAGKFTEDGRTFTIISNQGVYTYDLEGNLVLGGRHQVSQLPAFSGRMAADMEFFWIGDKILSVGHGRGAYPNNTTDFYEHYRGMVWFDTLERQVEQFMPLDENSVFRNGKAHDLSHMMPKLAVDQERIYWVHGVEPVLHIHDLKPPYEKIRRVALEIPDYTFNEGMDFNKADPRMINPDSYSGFMENIKVTEQFILITFFPGVPEADRDKFENLAWPEFQAKVRKAYPPRLMVRDLEGNFMREFTLSKDLSDRQWLYRDGYLWFLAPVNLDEEEDFVKIYKVALEPS